jgi:phosphoketolase
MIVFRTPKGWTGPKFVDGKPVEGTWRAHHVPIASFKKPEHAKQLEDWIRSYRPGELFDARGNSGRSLPRWRRRVAAARVLTLMRMAVKCCNRCRCLTSATTP